jgi:hypothetical protein
LEDDDEEDNAERRGKARQREAAAVTVPWGWCDGAVVGHLLYVGGGRQELW